MYILGILCNIFLKRLPIKARKIWKWSLNESFKSVTYLLKNVIPYVTMLYACSVNACQSHATGQTINGLRRALYEPWLSDLWNAFHPGRPSCHRQGLDRRSICASWTDRSETEAGLEGCSCGVKPGLDGPGEHGTGASQSMNMAACGSSVKGRQRNRRDTSKPTTVVTPVVRAMRDVRS